MKKWIKLSARADIGGEVRRPEEGAIAVDAKRAVELIDEGKAEDADVPVPGAEGLDGQTVAELRDTAEAEGVELHGATRKDEIVDAIVEHRQAPAGE